MGQKPTNPPWGLLRSGKQHSLVVSAGSALSRTRLPTYAPHSTHWNWAAEAVLKQKRRDAPSFPSHCPHRAPPWQLVFLPATPALRSWAMLLPSRWPGASRTSPMSLLSLTTGFAGKAPRVCTPRESSTPSSAPLLPLPWMMLSFLNARRLQDNTPDHTFWTKSPISGTGEPRQQGPFYTHSKHCLSEKPGEPQA